ncbi:hypothetical protein QYE76_043517 [Lolium multiflorum]|uniref:Uncharacterized protein n=1 Tax=Lolium multiflorum TaxID=4521 RepID=A0AAD8WW47_LOLMU|nr:hypothetical protein QYE76_043517 [Lolium multiflorum]
MHAPRDAHWAAVKQILRYVCGTMGYGFSLHASPSTSTDLFAYSDADWAGCPDTRRSTSGYCVYLGSSLVSWSSKRQPTVSRCRATVVFCDNVSAVYLSANPVLHRRTKHIELDIHFVLPKVPLAAPMGELGCEISGGVSKVDGEVSHVLNASFERIHVLIGGEVMMWLLLLLRPYMFFFKFFFSFGFILLLG